MSKVTVATVAMTVSHDKKVNLKKFYRYIDEAAAKGAKLIVFPEQSLHGYLHNLGQIKMESLRHQHEVAEYVPEGDSTQALIAKAKEKDIYIIWGMSERDKDRIDVLYNVNVLVGPEGFIGVYRKVHQPLDELHVFYPGQDFPVFETTIGKIGMLICYDQSFPEAARELALNGAEILVMTTAWPLTAIGSDYRTDHCMYLFNLYNRTRAAENQCFFIGSNHIGVSGDHDFCGHSRIVGADGVTLAELGYEEGMVMASIDVKADIIKARTESFLGLSQLKDRRPIAYKRIPEDF